MNECAFSSVDSSVLGQNAKSIFKSCVESNGDGRALWNKACANSPKGTSFFAILPSTKAALIEFSQRDWRSLVLHFERDSRLSTKRTPHSYYSVLCISCHFF